MSPRARLKVRHLKPAEFDIVKTTRHPDIKQLSDGELKIVAQRLRRARDRAKDISAQQKREMRGKADPRRTKRARHHTGQLAKAQVLRKAIQRVEAEMGRRENVAAATPTQAELSQRALKLKLRQQASPHRDPGRSVSSGMKPKERKKPLTVGPSRMKIGRVSQAGKVAQARKDSRN